MATYASQTSVSAEKSRGEIERVLQRYGASSFAYGWAEGYAVVGFEAHDRQVRFLLPLPDQKDTKFTRTETGRTRTQAAAREAYGQAVRQRWRALALVIKAKLEAVESGIVTFEQEFAMHMMLPTGEPVGAAVSRAIETAYATGQVPPLLALEG